MSPVEEYILEQPERIRPVLTKLRGLVLSASPYLEEKLVYNIPFFYGIKRIFYLNPKNNWADLGFCEGHLLGESPLFRIQNRTQVKTIRFYSLNEIDKDIVLPIIHEAIIIDRINNNKG